MEQWRVKVADAAGGGHDWQSYEEALSSAHDEQKAHGNGRVTVEFLIEPGEDPVEMSVDAMRIWHRASRGVVWEQVACFGPGDAEGAKGFNRARIKGGWLLRGIAESAPSLFVPDPQHEWDGTTIDQWREELVGLEGSPFWRAMSKAKL